MAGDSLIVLRIAAAARGRRDRVDDRIDRAPPRRRRHSAKLLAMIGDGHRARACSPTGSFYSMNVIELFFWTAIVRVLIDAIDEPSDRALDPARRRCSAWACRTRSACSGSAPALRVGLLLTPARRLLLTRGPWMAGAIAAVIFLPHVLWQIAHGWPTLEFIRNASRDKMQVNTPLSFLADQVMNMHPLTLPIWVAGLSGALVRADRSGATGCWRSSFSRSPRS